MLILSKKMTGPIELISRVKAWEQGRALERYQVVTASCERGTLPCGCPPQRPRAVGSSLMPQDSVPRPHLSVGGFGFLLWQYQHADSHLGGWGTLLSGIKEEPTALGRCGGQPLSRVPHPPGRRATNATSFQWNHHGS